MRALVALCAAGIVVAACFTKISEYDAGTLRVFFDGVSETATRAGEAVDTDDFLLTVEGPDGELVYSGRFGDSPEAFSVKPGAYTVNAVSREFSGPEYDAPVYGDTKVVVVATGEVASVALNCGMQNCGLRLDADAGFRLNFPKAVLYMKSDDGSLQFNYGERRTAYFRPGKVTVTMDNEGDSSTLFTKHIAGRQVLCVGLSAAVGGSSEGGAGIDILVDTTKEWIHEEYEYGKEAGTPEGALSVSEARGSAGLTGVWVYGYVVGCATSTSKVEFEEPFSKNTNIVLGERGSTTDRSYCLSVELKAGALRDVLNLSDNPSLKGKKVWVKGDVVSSYYGLPGMKNLSEYSF